MNLHRALRVRAAGNGRSTEAEVRYILAGAVKLENRVRLVDALAALGREIGLTNENFEAIKQARHQAASPAVPLRFD